MAERIELSEAIRSILDEDGKEQEMDSEANIHGHNDMDDPPANHILRNTTWDPCHAPGRSSSTKMKQSGKSKPNFRSPPKKRRHINEVIILRNPRRKSKPSPKLSATDVLKRTADTAKQLETSKQNGKSIWDSLESQNSIVKNSSNSSSQESLESLQSQNFDFFDGKPTHDSSTPGVNDKFDFEMKTPICKEEKPLTKKKTGDDSLTNITWLRRMTAPELDPHTLQTSKVSDPRLERPPYSYSTLIQFAISTATSGRMTLREIYQWIEIHFPYFRSAKLGWRNSIRHNLSLHKIFIREPPVGHGQPAFWTLRPGTVVRLPEKTMFVAKTKSGQNLSSVSESRHQSHKHKSSHKRSSTESGRKEEKKRKEQYILPRPAQQPLALVPVPIFLSTDSGTQMVTNSATGEPILSPIPINLLPEAQLRSMFTPRNESTGQRKMVKIAPKMTTTEIPPPHNTSNSSLNLQSSFPNATFSTSSGALRDSGIGTDVEGTFHESLVASGSQDIFGGSPPERKHLPIKKRGSPWNRPRVTSSTPHRNAKRAENVRPLSEVPDISIFDELPSFNFTPTKTPNRKSKRKLTTPSRSCAPCPDWLSPIRGLTPFKFGEDFTNLKDDLDVTPPRTGLTPKIKQRQMASVGLSTPKNHRSPTLGSLSDLGLSGLTPERISEFQNQSFSKMFGGDLSFEMDSEGFWSMLSPSH